MTAPRVDGRRGLGAAGERLTARFLQARGYRIVAQNVRLSRGEIDLVAEHGEALVLIEVRLRRSVTADAALESISPRKQRRLRLLAAEYCTRLKEQPAALRIDVVGISLDRQGRLREIRLIENAVEGDGSV